MPTYYRPTERRGKKVIYRSTDPKELELEKLLNKVVPPVLLILLIIGLLFSHPRR